MTRVARATRTCNHLSTSSSSWCAPHSNVRISRCDHRTSSGIRTMPSLSGTLSKIAPLRPGLLLRAHSRAVTIIARRSRARPRCHDRVGGRRQLLARTSRTGRRRRAHAQRAAWRGCGAQEIGSCRAGHSRPTKRCPPRVTRLTPEAAHHAHRRASDRSSRRSQAPLRKQRRCVQVAHLARSDGAMPRRLSPQRAPGAAAAWRTLVLGASK